MTTPKQSTNPIQAQAKSYGIATDYYDVDGGYHVIDTAILQYFIKQFQEAEAAAEQNKKQQTFYDHVHVIAADKQQNLDLSAHIDCFINEYQLLDEHNKSVLTTTLSAPTKQLTLPALPYGYYTLRLNYSDTQRLIRWRLIVAPKSTYRPSLPEGMQQRGVNLQLYSLRSEKNWGIGDFADLADAIILAAEQGYDFIGINPLHALYPSQPEWCSPYSPSSRLCFHWIYLDLEAIPEFTENPTATTWGKQIQPQLNPLRQAHLVDYVAVSHLKMQALRLAFAELNHNPSAIYQQRRQALADFIEQGGKALHNQSAFYALNHCLAASADTKNPDNSIGWLGWAMPFTDNQHPYVKQFINDNAAEIRFYSYLQWLLTTQLQALKQLCQEQGLSLGLYGDLAVGAARGSADVWLNPALYFVKDSIGAPPDPLGPVGQNWQLPPINPQMLIKEGFQSFIDLLRVNMSYCGALRIDHVMGLYRLWLIPEGKTAADGAYIHYPFETLMAILAIESQRNQCLVIGEDLGTVPDEVRQTLKRYQVLSYDVLYFAGQEIGQDFPPRWRRPEKVKRDSLTVISTHDLPPLRGWWHCQDLNTLAALNILSPQALTDKFDARLSDKQALLSALKTDGFLPKDYAGDAMSMAMHPQLNTAIHAYAAAGGSCLLALQPENVCQIDFAFNVPGTTTEHPNWQHKLPATLDKIFPLLPFAQPIDKRGQHHDTST